MHILETPRPCADCGRPALRLHGPDNEPRCTLCQAEEIRRKAPPFREKADAPTWEIGQRVGE